MPSARHVLSLLLYCLHHLWASGSVLGTKCLFSVSLAEVSKQSAMSFMQFQVFNCCEDVFSTF